jgi:hypothetical protein
VNIDFSFPRITSFRPTAARTELSKTRSLCPSLQPTAVLWYLQYLDFFEVRRRANLSFEDKQHGLGVRQSYDSSFRLCAVSLASL